MAGERELVAALAALLVVSSGVPVGLAQGGGDDESLAIFNPSGIYFPGQEVDLGGAAAAGVDEVAVYVRDRGDWELVDVNEDGRLDGEDAISVDQEGLWRENSVDLSNASEILRFPGFYSIGVIDVLDARTANGTLAETLSPGEFIGSTSAQRPIAVKDPVLEGAFVTIDGQVATEDAEVAVRGIARGMEEVLVVMVDPQGDVVTEQVPARGLYDVFDDDVALANPDGRLLSEGRVVGLIVALGRDDAAGDGDLPGQSTASIDGLEAYVLNLDRQFSQDQVVASVFGQTTEEPGSDDAVREQIFRFTGGRTVVRDVVPAGATDAEGIQPIESGETMVIRGLTNRKPDENTIRVEVVEGPSADRLPVAGTDSWGPDGRWRATIDTTGAEPGTYQLAVEVGDRRTETRTFRIVSRGGRESDRANGSAPAARPRTAWLPVVE